VVEHGKVIDTIVAADLAASGPKLREYLGV
jgi:hypothetical protein